MGNAVGTRMGDGLQLSGVGVPETFPYRVTDKFLFG